MLAVRVVTVVDLSLHLDSSHTVHNAIQSGLAS